MGSGSSKHVPILKCPKDYDPEKFEKICALFDKLDQDSNLGVSSDELTQIAALHVKNCQDRLRKRVQSEKAFLERRLQEIEEECQQNLDGVRFTAATEKQSTRQQSETKQAQIEKQIAAYEALDVDGRENVFMNVLMPKDASHIDFWTFFEYMKTRTGDIGNIKA